MCGVVDETGSEGEPESKVSEEDGGRSQSLRPLVLLIKRSLIFLQHPRCDLYLRPRVRHQVRRRASGISLIPSCIHSNQPPFSNRGQPQKVWLWANKEGKNSYLHESTALIKPKFPLFLESSTVPALRVSPPGCRHVFCCFCFFLYRKDAFLLRMSVCFKLHKKIHIKLNNRKTYF